MVAHKRTPANRPSSRTSKPLTQQLTSTGEQLNATSADFLKIDVKTGLTFSGIALEADDDEKKERNRKNARKAYDSILHLQKNVTFTPSDEIYMHEMLGRLKNDLARLGEKV